MVVAAEAHHIFLFTSFDSREGESYFFFLYVSPFHTHRIKTDPNTLEFFFNENLNKKILAAMLKCAHDNVRYNNIIRAKKKAICFVLGMRPASRVDTSSVRTLFVR